MKFDIKKSRWARVLFCLCFYASTSLLSSATHAGGDCQSEKILRKSQESDFSNGSLRLATSEERSQWLWALDTFLQYALKNGKSTISWLNLNEIRASAKDITLCINTSRSAAVGSGSRTGGVYFVEEKTVILNLARLHSLQGNPGAGIMLVHEFCGALGCPDEKFGISSILYLKTHAKEIGEANLAPLEAALSRFLDANPRREKNIQFAARENVGAARSRSEREGGHTGSGGGASGVGGGGNSYLGEIKTFLLRWALSQDAVPVPQALDMVLWLDLEPDDAPEFFELLLPKVFPGIRLGLFQGKSIAVIEAEHWERIRSDSGKSNIVERTEFIRNLFAAGLAISGVPEKKIP